MKLEQGFSYSGSDTYEVNDIDVNELGLSLYDKLTGVGGVDYIPYDGATVTVMTGAINTTDSVKKLEPSLNNKIYYLVSDVLYSDADKDTIISLATEVPVYLDAPTQKYMGDFVFNNPNDYDYLYLIWDYADNMSSGSASYIGDATTKYIDIDFGTNVGKAGVDYETLGKPTRYVLNWNGENVKDTGYVGLNSTANYDDLIAAGVDAADIKLVTPLDGLVDNGTSSLIFNKYLSDENTAQLAVYSPLDSSEWRLTKRNVSLKSFYICTDAGLIDDVCSQVADTNYYHNGEGNVPAAGDTIYTTSNGLTVYDGGDDYHLVNLTLMTVPATSGAVYTVVDANGNCTLSAGCDCLEATVPFIHQEDIYLTKGKYTNIKLSASGNPTSWSITNTCHEYLLDGGTEGTLFSVVNCKGVTENITVSSGDTYNTCSPSTPTITYGNGSLSDLGVCFREVLPNGISLNTTQGQISGVANNVYRTGFILKATNCQGDSVEKTINIIVTDNEVIKPFAIDVENFGDTGDAACVITPVYSLLYHNGNGRVPYRGDTVYTDSKGTDVFKGGEMWYKIDHSTYSIKVCAEGIVCDTNECPLSTTTTTSTTSTTTTTTLPATGTWHTAHLCNDVTVFARLYDSTATVIANNSIIKTTDGNCWKKTTTTTAGYPYLTIENPVVIYGNCNTCRGVTTTTTTTTTTTAPVITSFQLQDNNEVSAYLACLNFAETLSTYYHNGASAKPIVGDVVFEDALGATPWNGNGYWYYMPNTSDYAIRVDNTGTVLNVSSCTGITTTTTTTAAPYTRYLGQKCSGTPSGNFALEYPSATLLTVGQVVKDNNGDCFTITSVSPIGTVWDEVVALRGSYTYIYFLYDNCLDCQGVTTTTTSTTTTSTTSTTSTSTTTTTTLPPLTNILARAAEDWDAACTAAIITIYVDGPLSTVGTKAYFWNGSTYVKFNYVNIKPLRSSTVYEHDGSTTGVTHVCS